MYAIPSCLLYLNKAEKNSLNYTHPLLFKVVKFLSDHLYLFGPGRREKVNCAKFARLHAARLNRNAEILSTQGYMCSTVSVLGGTAKLCTSTITIS